MEGQKNNTQKAEIENLKDTAEKLNKLGGDKSTLSKSMPE